MMDCTVSHTGYMYFGIWMKRNSTWGKQFNNVARKGSSEDKVNKSSIYLFFYLFIYLFIFTVCVTYHIIYLNKWPLDKIQKRSKIMKNMSTFSFNCCGGGGGAGAGRWGINYAWPGLKNSQLWWIHSIKQSDSIKWESYWCVCWK